MDNEKILALYKWHTGSCFRCIRTGVDTATIATLHPRSDQAHEVTACRWCVLELEDMKQRAAARAGLPYDPGHAGEAL